MLKSVWGGGDGGSVRWSLKILHVNVFKIHKIVSDKSWKSHEIIYNFILPLPFNYLHLGIRLRFKSPRP